MAYHVVISEDAYRRLKLFSAKYNLTMKQVLDWFIYAIIDEEGEPQISGVEKVLAERIEAHKARKEAHRLKS